MSDNLITQTNKLLNYGNTQLAGKGITEPQTTLRNVLDKISDIEVGSSEKIAQIIDGTITELTAQDLEGATKIAQFSLSSKSKLISLELPTSVTSIESYSCDQCSNLQTLTINTTLTSIGANAFENDQNINSEVNFEINGPIDGYVFRNCFKVSKSLITGAVTSLGRYAFTGYGRDRANPNLNPFKFDFRNGTYTMLDDYCFSDTKYITLINPPTLNTIKANVFSNTKYSDIYFTSETVPTTSTAVFQNAFQSNIFVPYNHINDYKTATNWTDYAYQIHGYAFGDGFEAGQELPSIDASGYSLTWYSDKQRTQVITHMPSPAQEIYCEASTEVVGG